MGRRLSILLLAVAALAAGCGGKSSSGEDAKTAAQIYQDAQKAAGSAKGVHITGSITDAGKRVDLTFDLAAESGRGTMAQGNARADVARVGNVAYMRANKQFWTAFANAQAAQLLRDKWLSGTSAKAPFKSFATFLSLGALVDSAFAKHGRLTKLGVRTYKGQKVVAIRDPKSKETLLVADTGTPYPVAATGDGEIVFSNWNTPVDVKAPKGAVDISSFGG
jgi:hypothetical protein